MPRQSSAATTAMPSRIVLVRAARSAGVHRTSNGIREPSVLHGSATGAAPSAVVALATLTTRASDDEVPAAVPVVARRQPNEATEPNAAMARTAMAGFMRSTSYRAGLAKSMAPSLAVVAIAEPQHAPHSATRHHVQVTARDERRQKLERAADLMRHPNVSAVVVERADREAGRGAISPREARSPQPGYASPMRLYRITAIVEAADDIDASAVADAIARSICPHPPTDGHNCPRGWITMQAELTDAERTIWAAPDALNR
jgi:hypothetical protein